MTRVKQSDRRLATLALALVLAACGGGIDSPPAFSSPNGVLPGQGGAGKSAATSGGPAVAQAAVDCSQNPLAPRRLWRLTPKQYDNTLHDLLGVDSTYGAGFPADELGSGFSNASDSLRMSPLLADKVQSAAKDLAAKVDLTRFAACSASQADDNCLRQLVTQLGERTFRRPLTAADIDRYMLLAKSAGAFDAGARVVVSAMLQSPNFLYRFELGKPAGAGQYQLDDYEVASELSYMLWQTMPDDALFAAAKAGQLHEPAQVTAQVERMLKTDRAKLVLRGFVFDWLGLSAIATVPKDATTYPELTNELRQALTREAEMFIDHAMAAPGDSLAALLTTETTYLDAQLAAFYGVPLPAAATATAQPVSLYADQQRRGILTLGGVQLTHSRSNDSSPIHRGKLVRERLLCQQLPPPPANAALQPPALDPTKTARERYAEHSSNAACSGCHKLMDPIGYAFEHFDGIGRFRPDDNGHPIDVSGEVISYNPTDVDGKFVGTDALIDKLETSASAHGCYALEWFRFAYGEGSEQAADPSCFAKRYQQAAEKSDGSLTALVTLLTQSDWMLMRGPGSGAGVAAPPPMAATSTPPPMAAAGTAAPVPTASDPTVAPPAGLKVDITVDNDWGKGYCRTYQLTNTSGAPVTWSIPLEIRGKMNQHWECDVTGDSGAVTFTGVDHNRTLAPAAMAQFGFCSEISGS